MDSKSTNKNKRVLSSRRRISSIQNQSPTKLNASKGDIKHRISDLIKTNKTLAVALQDARCELSFKQNVLEKASEYFKTIMLARAKMTHIWSALNSVLQEFDGTMEMLKCDYFKLSDIAPIQTSGKFKNQIKKIAEAVGSVNEESLVSCEQENVGSYFGISADLPISRPRVSSDGCPTPMEVTEDIADKTSSSSEQADLEASTKSCIKPDKPSDPVMPGSPSVKSEASVDAGDKSIITDSLIIRNDTGTPKLSLLNVMPTVDLQKSPVTDSSLLKKKDSSVVKRLEKNSGVLISICKEKDSCVKKIPKIRVTLNKPKSAQKVLNSKIPRLHASKNEVIKEASLSGNFSKENSVCSKTSNQKNVSKPKEINETDCRRKTFVVQSLPETDVISGEEEGSDTNNSENEQNSEIFKSRKTFVISDSSALEKKRKSINNKRKTYVKKCNKNNSRKSTKIRRGTFVLNDVNENCTEEDGLLTDCSINSELDGLVKESNEPCAVIEDEALPLDTDHLREATKNLQLFKEDCFIINNPEIKNNENNSVDLFPGANSEGTSKTNLENSSDFERKRRVVNNERKILVIKGNEIKRGKSVKNKRGTFVFPDINENCTVEHQLLRNCVNQECNDLAKEKLNKPVVMTVDEALPSICNNFSGITPNLQLSNKNCRIDEPRMMDQEGCSKEVLPEISAEEASTKDLVTSQEVKDVNKLISNEKDTQVVKSDEKNCEIDELKSPILPSLELPVQFDESTNVTQSTSEAKTSKEDENNFTVDITKANSENFLLENIYRRKACIIISPLKYVTGKGGTLEKETVILQPSSQLQSRVSKSAEGESEKRSALAVGANHNEEGESLLKSEEKNSECESSTEHAADGIKNIAETDGKNLQPIVFTSDEEVIIPDSDENKRKHKSQKRISYKKFFESSYSECESISGEKTFEDEVGLFSIPTPPVRGKVSFSKKRLYTFHKNADAKTKPQKHSKRFKNYKNLANELSAMPVVTIKCEGSNINSDVNQISENVEKNSLLHSTNPESEKTEVDPKREVRFCDTQEVIQSAVKITENVITNNINTDIENRGNSTSETLDGQDDKNVNKIILSTISPVISLDKCLNDIKRDFGDKKGKADKNTFSGETSAKLQQNTEADSTNNIKKQTVSVKDKRRKNKDPSKNQPKKKKKQVVVEFDVGKENVEDSEVNSKNVTKPGISKSTAIVVEAEIHPPPRTLNRLDTNIEKTVDNGVSIVLNDIFESKKIDLPVNNNEKRERNCFPLSNSNSSNIQKKTTDKSNTAAKEGVDGDLAECKRSRRARPVNYSEPSLNKKMRR